MTVRRTFLWVVALIALFAISAPAALAGDDSDLATPPAEATSSAPETPAPPAPSEPAPTEPAPVDPPAAEPVPVEPAPTDPSPEPAPSDPAPVDPGQANPAPSQGPVNPGPSDPAPSEPASSGPAPAAEAPAPPTRPDTPSAVEETTATPSDDAEEPAGIGEPEPEAEPQDVGAIAHNRSVVFQVVWQVQEGCRTHCYRTSQSQTVVQWSSTTQSATATAGGEGVATSGSAEAQNESITIQFVWQLQLGCVAFCYETSQTQSASQWAQTLQEAIAQGELEAWAENLSETLQYVWQIQHGCEQECYGVYQSQTITQGQSTTQTATATAGEDHLTMIVLGPDGVVVLPGWLVALAENQGATIQTIYQHQRALCLEYCEGDVQLQEAIQEALTNQEAVAIAWVGPKPVDNPPSVDPPSDDPPAEGPPAVVPAPEDPSTPATPSVSGASSVAVVIRPTRRATPRTRRETRRNRARGGGLTRAGAGEKLQRQRTVSRNLVRESSAVRVSAGFESEATGVASSESTVIARADATRSRATPKHAAASVAPIAQSGFELAPGERTDDDSTNWLLIALLAAAVALLGTAAALRIRDGNSSGNVR